MTCTMRRFGNFPATDWVLEFTNEGDDDTPGNMLVGYRKRPAT